MTCNKCGTSNNNKANFCVHCGNELAAKSNKNCKNRNRYKKASPKKLDSIKILWSVFGLFLLGGILCTVIDSNTQTSSITHDHPTFEIESPNPAVETKLEMIASQFICVCGGCDELPLESCGCAAAQKERQFIREKVSTGWSDEQIINTVKNNYGGMET